MRIGIIGAMQNEVSEIIENMDSSNEIKYVGTVFYEGKINGVNVVVTQCGVGKVNAAIATSVLISIFECNFILNTGIAGGLGLNTKDVVVASSVSYHDFDVSAFGYAYGQVPRMPLEYMPSLDGVLMIKSTLKKLDIPYKNAKVFSGDQFVTSLEPLAKANPGDVFATEMEGAAIAQVCTKAGVDFVILRYISDCIGSESQIADYSEFEEEMSKRSALICLQIIKNLE